MALFLLASASAAATSILFSLLLSLETYLISNSPLVVQNDLVGNNDMNQLDGSVGTVQYENYLDHQHHNHHRQLQLSMTEKDVTSTTNNNNNNQIVNDNSDNPIHGQSTSSPGVIVNMLRRARDKVDEKDVPFLLQVPYTNSDVIYNIMTDCYGLVGREYWDLKEIQRDQKEKNNVVDQFYVSSHDRPKEVSCTVVGGELMCICYTIIILPISLSFFQYRPPLSTKRKTDVPQLWSKVPLPIHPTLPRRCVPPNTQTQRSDHPNAPSSRLRCRKYVLISSKYQKKRFKRIDSVC